MTTQAHTSRTTAALLAAALVVGMSLPVEAQERSATTPGGWSFALTPYVWFASLEGDVATISGLPTTSVDASFEDIIENTDMALMLAAEASYGRFGVLADINYLDLSADGDTPGPLFDNADVEVETLFATVAGFYRAPTGGRLNLDLLAGARIWYVDTEIDLSAGLLPARSVDDDDAWADPIVGLRGHGPLGRGFFVTGAADIGGFGVASDFTWQLLGTLGYRFNHWFSARAGYRHLDVDYDDDGFVWDVELSGPIAGATFRF